MQWMEYVDRKDLHSCFLEEGELSVSVLSKRKPLCILGYKLSKSMLSSSHHLLVHSQEMQLSGKRDGIKGAKEESLSCIHCGLFCSSKIKLIMVIRGKN